jgi:hypothetical protein
MTFSDDQRPNTQHETRSKVDGTWNVTLLTPVGTQEVIYKFVTEGQQLRGTATQDQDVTELIDPTLNGTQLSWTQHVTKPMRLKLVFNVDLDGNQMTGTAKANFLPPVSVRGTQVLL